MHVRWLVVVSAASLELLTGCATASTLGLARPLRKGSFQFVVSPEAYGAFDATDGTLNFAPHAEVAARWGIADRLELGAKAWLPGAALEMKIGLMEAPTMDSGIDVSLSPGFSYSSFNITILGSTAQTTWMTLGLPVLIGINLAGHQLVLAPKVVDLIAFSTDSTGNTGSVNVLNVGTSVGFALKVTDWIRLMPEVTMMYPLVTFGQSGTTVNSATGAFIQAGVGLMFGGKYENEPEPQLPISSNAATIAPTRMGMITSTGTR